MSGSSRETDIVGKEIKRTGERYNGQEESMKGAEKKKQERSGENRSQPKEK